MRSRDCRNRSRNATSERAQAQAYLDMAANRSTRDQSQFLNGLIQRKAFSWTRVFEDLEQVMPPNLHVVSLRPELNEQNQMELEMKVAGDTRAAAVELVHRMEGSKHFQGAQLVQEGQGSEAGAGVAASVVSIYVPDSSGQERKVMPDLGNSRRKLKIAIGAMLAADVVAVAVLFSPLVGSADSRKLANQHNCEAELTKKTREVEPLRGMDKKIVLAKDSDRRILQGPLCREGFRSGQ